jgi:hypothetical protein
MKLGAGRSFSAADLTRPVNHPERSDMTLETIVENHGRP